MASHWILGFLILASQQVLNIYCQGVVPTPPPPEVSGSYKAIGELVKEIPESPGYVIQDAFEENYDEENQKSAFTAWQSGNNITFIENYRTNQTLVTCTEKNETKCEVVTPLQWNEYDAPGSLSGYLSGDGQIRFSVKQLLSLHNYYKWKTFSPNAAYRGIPANEWLYEIKNQTKEGINITLTVYEYWSDPTWNTTSGIKDPVPLGFIITKITSGPAKQLNTSNQQVNIFAFVRGAVDKAVFEPREGVYCKGDVKSEFPFPTFQKINAVSMRSELAFNDYQTVKSVDTWYDMKNKLLRIDRDRIDKEQPAYTKEGRLITWDVTSKELDATFEIDIFKGKMTCAVKQIKDYKFEAQDTINPKLEAKFWDLHHFFGVNTTDYRYIGKTAKRNIPCHIFQGLRKDYPEVSHNITSLWEWCFAAPLTENDDIVDFRDGELPLVSLQIHFLESNVQAFPKGFRLAHHFYDVLSEDPNVIYNTVFDVSRCFNKTQIKKLQFTIDVNITQDNLDTLENATSDPNFLQLWRQQILQGTGLSIGSLRITKMKSTIYNRIMYVMFTLLDVHPDLPNKSGYKSLEKAENDLRTAIDGGKLNIKYPYEKKLLDLNVKPKSLVLQVDPTVAGGNRTTQEPSVTPDVLTSETETKPDVDSSTGSSVGSSTGSSVGSSTGSSVGSSTGSGVGSSTGSGVGSSTGSGVGSSTGSGVGSSTEKTVQSSTATNVESSTEPNVDTSKKEDPGNSKATVAGVTVAMLAIGISAGAAGTFYKFRGLPRCLRRA